MLGKLRDALVAAGADENTARDAAEEVASYENRLSTLDIRSERLEGKVNLLQWMVGFNLVITVAILFRVFLHG